MLLCMLCSRQISNQNSCHKNNFCVSCQKDCSESDQSRFSADDVDCKYYVPTNFNQLYDSLKENVTFSMVHFNCRSLKRNFDNVQVFLQCCNCNFTVIGVSETWFTGSESTFQLPNYTFHNNYRSNKRGGGVGVYVQNKVKIKRRFDLEIFNDFVEMLSIELFCDPKNIILCVIYRPPGHSITQFIDNIQIPLHNIVSENKECFLLGDFNINLLDMSSQINSFVDTMLSYSYSPLISKATRITSESATLLDNIYTNNPTNVLKSGIFVTDISDHYPVFALANFQFTQSPTYCFKRKINEKSIIQFCTLLSEVDWSDIYVHYNASDRFRCFLDKYTSLYNKCFPLKKSALSENTNPKPWFNAHLKKMCNKKYALYRKFKRNPTVYRETRYKHYRNKVNFEIRKRKLEYYNMKFGSAQGNIKNTWNVINEVLNKSKKSVLCESIEVDGSVIDDKQIIVDKFNDYFSTIGEKIVNDMQSCNEDFSIFLPSKCPNAMFFQPITHTDILNVVHGFKDGKSPGHDEINIKVFKKSIYFILEPLCDIFNSSLEQGIFPQSLKIARVVPIFKKGARNVLNNYRPISILSVFSKLLEKLVYNRLLSFITKNNILYQRQFGFRQGFSTYMALLEFTNKISQAFENREFLVGVFLDLSKAFDCINHRILLQKLQCYGIRGVCLKWFYSYLYNQKQYTTIDGFNSDLSKVSVGVPQGSVLGPLLFILFINDLHSVSAQLFSVIFADDTNFFVSGNNESEINNILNIELSKIYRWFSCNKLMINLEKTCYMIFKPKNKIIDENKLQLYMHTFRLRKVTQTKFLGVIIDERLTWKEHINDICCKLSKSVGALYRLKQFIPKQILLTLYNTMILPYITYCNIVWGHCAIYLTNRILILQKRAVRIISNSHPLTKTTPLFHKYSILRVTEICEIQTANFMFLFFKGNLPNTFSDILSYDSPAYRCNTRSSTNLRLPLMKYNFSHTTIKYTGPKCWNHIPANLKTCTTLSSFKRKYKSFIFNRHTGTCNVKTN